MRKGHNPAKSGAKSYQSKRLAIVTLVYIPVQEGYFEQSLEIFKIHLASVRQYTPEPFDYIVFDNGSCSEVKRELESLLEKGFIDSLILSNHNLGKTGALNQVLGGLPNEWICYADSDMLFRPGWLEESWKINESFPGCGMIGAQVIFPDWDVDRGNTRFRKTEDPRYVFSHEKPPQPLWEEYCRARGINGERAEFYREIQLDRVRNVDTGIEAYLGGNSHQQWLARGEVIRQILPLPVGLQLAREMDTYQDQKIDQLNYLHLTTTSSYLYHMGNSIDPEIVPEVNRLKLDPDLVNEKNKKVGQKKSLAWKALVWIDRTRQGRKMLRRLYNNLYEIFSS